MNDDEQLAELNTLLKLFGFTGCAVFVSVDRPKAGSWFKEPSVRPYQFRRLIWPNEERRANTYRWQEYFVTGYETLEEMSVEVHEYVNRHQAARAEQR